MNLEPPLLDGIQAHMVDTARLRTHILSSGATNGEALVLVHGNCSAARFFEELMLAIPQRYRVIAPDMRGYGRTELKPLDATRGVRDFSDDLHALVEALGLKQFHLVGWSLGGNVAIQYVLDHPGTLASLTLIAPGSPYGFGGTRDLEGTPTNSDYAGSGAGVTNAEFIRLLALKDRSSDSPFSPRNVINALYYKTPFKAAREDIFLEEVLTTVCSLENYPGDAVDSPNWPGKAPGVMGITNALSPKYLQQATLADLAEKPPILWIRGDSDTIVSDTSTSDIGYLGKLGLVPGWPGDAAYPPHPMVSQMRAVLERYAENGGSDYELVLYVCGHSPHSEKTEVFFDDFVNFLDIV